MNPEQIKAFIKVAELNSFSLAADALFITQSAISKRISLLESKYEQPLFDRIGRSIRLTEAGEIVLQRAKEIERISEQAKSEVAALNKLPVGTINIATSHHIGLYRLPPLLQSFVKNYPEIKLNMHFTDSEIAHQDIISGEVDIAIATLPDIRKEPAAAKVKHIHYWTDHLVIVCNKEHPLNKIPSPKLADLANYPAILPGFQTFTRRIIHEIFEPLNIDIPIAFSTNYLETIKHMVQVGLGWSILPKIMLDKNLCLIDIPSFEAKRSLGIMINQGVTQSYALQLFLQHIENKITDNN